MLSIKEQLLLLKMLQFEKMGIKFRAIGSNILEKQRIYETISALSKKNYVLTRHFTDRRNVFYELTGKGFFQAVWLSNDIDTDFQYRNLEKDDINWDLLKNITK